jgi:hypothetical protein
VKKIAEDRPDCATILALMAQPRRLTDDEERQLVAIVAAGVAQGRAAAAFGVSRRTACRVLRRRREEPRELTLAEVLAEFAESVDRPATRPTRGRRRARGDGWERAARMLEEAAPERWGDPG